MVCVLAEDMQTDIIREEISRKHAIIGIKCCRIFKFSKMFSISKE
jgi:hypothetical protein